MTRQEIATELLGSLIIANAMRIPPVQLESNADGRQQLVDLAYQLAGLVEAKA